MVRLGLFASVLVCQFLFILNSQAAEKPNIIILLCDDLGYGDLGCFGHPHIKTPNLDNMAAEGIRFTNCYSAAPVCSASRAGLLTGKYSNRTGVYDWIPPNHPVHLRKSEVTIAKTLQQAGYWTGHSGKWHLNGKFNSPDQPQPSDLGFTAWYSTQNNAAPSHQNPKNFVINGTPLNTQDGFSCMLVANQARKWIREQAKVNTPFFMYVCFHEPHEPVVSPPDLVQKYLPVAQNEDEAQFFANVENVDIQVGRILQTLKDLEIDEKTLVFFSSDNGPETLNRYKNAHRSYGRTGGLRDMKLHIYDGGIKVPGIARWPGKIKPGQIIDTPVCSIDFHPTCAEAAGVTITSPIDGTSLMPLLTQAKPFVREKPLFWHYYRALTAPRCALREGDWKIVGIWDGPNIKDGKMQQDDPYGNNVTRKAVDLIKTAKLVSFELYNIKQDPAESHDLSQQEIEVFNKLRQKLLATYVDVQQESPLWEELK